MKLGSESEGPRHLDTTAPPDRSCEIASVLFTDIVSYSVLPIDQQSELLTALQQIVKGSAEFQQARARDAVITLPTGDGMALVFFGDPVAPVRCALEVAEALRGRPEIKLRMGIHSGPVFRHADIKDQLNVVGGGINTAQRVMDCGDAGHVLISGNVAEVLEQLSGWRDWVHDLGVFEVKHGVKVHIYNLYKGDVGRADVPRKCPAAAQAAKPRRKLWKIALPVLAGLLIVAAALWRWHAPTPAPTAPAAERTISYYVTVQKYRDGRPYQEPFRDNGAHIFEAGYRIRLVFRSVQAGYLYILNEGPESTPQRPVFNTLFPSPKNNGGSALLDPGQELQIPQGGPIEFDKERGMEKVWLIWSKADQPELDKIMHWLNEKDQGAIGDPLQLKTIVSFLAKYSEPRPEATANPDRTFIKGGSDVLVSLLKLEHE